MKVVYEIFRKKPGFPHKYSNTEIEEVLREAQEEIARPIGGIMLDRTWAVIDVCMNELSRRSNDKSAKSSNRLAVVAVVISIMSLLASIWLSFSSDKQSRKWQQEEILLLDEINNSLRK